MNQYGPDVELPTEDEFAEPTEYKGEDVDGDVQDPGVLNDDNA